MRSIDPKPSPAALTPLTEIGDAVGIVGPFMPRLPGNWERLYESELTQMIRTVGTSLPRGDLEVLVLGAADVANVLALVEWTRPGPFRARTIELGTYIGIGEGEPLVAMAGERMWVGDCREVSAACTDPDAQGRGYARALVGRVVNRMLRTARTPFLHVESRNTRAIELYGALGFVRRAVFPLLHARRIGWRRGFVPSPSSFLGSRRPDQFVRAPPRGPRSGRWWLPHPSAQRRVPGDIAPVHPRAPRGPISNSLCKVAVACEMSTTTPTAGSK